MKQILFPKNRSSHVIPEDATAVIIGYQNWVKGGYYREYDRGYGHIDPGYVAYLDKEKNTRIFIPKKDMVGITTKRSDGSESFHTVLLTKGATSWQRINGMTLEYYLSEDCYEKNDGDDIVKPTALRTSMRLVYGYYM